MAVDTNESIAARAAVTLRVGESGDMLTTHESLLKQSSLFFRAALDKKWKEGSTLDIALPEDEVDIVAGYLHWLYSGGNLVPDNTKDDYRAQYSWLVKAYILGDKIQDDAFCDSVLLELAGAMDKIRGGNGSRHYPDGDVLHLVYTRTPQDSALRKMIVDIYAARARPQMFEKGLDNLPPEFLKEILVEISGRRPQLPFEPMKERCGRWYKQQ
ncbi:hypothetical protein PRZ48_013009 [Zasmidium cellare]|uniref:BTB domain-containing protein n=1 Tax=Zasmidium cellare TaxID=395010 RepID=A0ABR0E3D9_ZASCE|nr:hypothetical protein PRZ48_013009 [Zasmidium cellare]